MDAVPRLRFAYDISFHSRVSARTPLCQSLLDMWMWAISRVDPLRPWVPERALAPAPWSPPREISCSTGCPWYSVSGIDLRTSSTRRTDSSSTRSSPCSRCRWPGRTCSSAWACTCSRRWHRSPRCTLPSVSSRSSATESRRWPRRITRTNSSSWHYSGGVSCVPAARRGGARQLPTRVRNYFKSAQPVRALRRPPRDMFPRREAKSFLASSRKSQPFLLRGFSGSLNRPRTGDRRPLRVRLAMFTREIADSKMQRVTRRKTRRSRS